MIYLYAYTNHRSNLDALRRMGALWHQLNRQGIKAELIFNDYRAQQLGRELGLPLATTVETIMELDGVVNFDDIVVIDSPESMGERLRFYVEKYKKVFLVKECEYKSRFGEEILNLYIDGALVDLCYEESSSITKENSSVLIYGDSDYHKELLDSAEALGALGLQLYLGSYFQVKYEAELEKFFNISYESDEYQTIINNSKTIVTPMVQTALEAFSAGARVIWLDRGKDLDCVVELLDSIGIKRIHWEDWKELEKALDSTPLKYNSYANLLKEWATLIAQS